MRHIVMGLLGIVLSIGAAGSATAAHEAHTQPPIRVGIVLFNGVEIIDFAGPYEVFGSAGFGVVTLSADGKPVKTSMGLNVTPDASFADAPPLDVLLVPGGDEGDAANDALTQGFIRQRAGSAKSVLSVCTGAFILGSSGVLDGLKATTFTPRIDQLAKRFPKAQVIRDVRWADNGKVVTTAGLSSGIDGALHIVAKLEGDDEARTVAARLEYDWRNEDGYVRSRMADRYLPKEALQQAVAWPKDMKFDQRANFGDTRQWELRLHVTSATPASDLLGRLAKGMGDVGGWTRDGQRYRWSSQQEGHRVQLDMQTRPGASTGDYELDIALAVVS